MLAIREIDSEHKADINLPNEPFALFGAGFHIGGLDTNIYKGTSQEGKSDILFYLDA